MVGEHPRWQTFTPFIAINGVAVLLILLFSVMPLLYVAYLSFVDIRAGSLGGAYIGWENYQFVLDNPSTGIAFANTFYFSTLSVLLAVVIGTAIALLMDSKVRFAKLLIIGVVLPWAIPEVVNALIWKWIFDGHWGALNALLKAVGIINAYRSWLSEAATAMHCLIFAYAWKIVPFVVIIVYAALRAIPQEIIESAQVDGANAFETFYHIRLPMIAPALAVAVLFCVVFSMRAFDLVYLLTKGGPGDATTILSYYTYATTFEFGDVGAGAAVSVMLAAVTMAATWLYWRLLQRVEQPQ